MINEITLILGKKRFGKTTLAYELTKNKRTLFIDPKGQLSANDLEVVDFSPEIPTGRLKDFLSGKEERLALYMPREQCMILFGKLASLLFTNTDMQFWLVIDETQFFSDRSNIDVGLANLVSHGSHKGLNMIFIIREAHEIHKYLRSQSDNIISFRQDEPADLDWCEKLLENARETLPRLGRGEYVYLRKAAADFE